MITSAKAFDRTSCFDTAMSYFTAAWAVAGPLKEGSASASLYCVSDRLYRALRLQSQDHTATSSFHRSFRTTAESQRRAPVPRALRAPDGRQRATARAPGVSACDGYHFAESVGGTDTLPGDIARPERSGCRPHRPDGKGSPRRGCTETGEKPVASYVSAGEDQGAMPAAEDAQPRAIPSCPSLPRRSWARQHQPANIGHGRQGHLHAYRQLRPADPGRRYVTEKARPAQRLPWCCRQHAGSAPEASRFNDAGGTAVGRLPDAGQSTLGGAAASRNRAGRTCRRRRLPCREAKGSSMATTIRNSQTPVWPGPRISREQAMAALAVATPP